MIPKTNQGVRGITLMLLLLLGLGAPRAQPPDFEQTHSLRRIEPGVVEIRSTVITNNSCYSAGTIRPSPPPGQDITQDTVALTLLLLHAGAYACVESPKAVYFRKRIGIAPDITRIAIFIQDPRSQTVTRRDLAVVGN